MIGNSDYPTFGGILSTRSSSTLDQIELLQHKPLGHGGQVEIADFLCLDLEFARDLSSEVAIVSAADIEIINTFVTHNESYQDLYGE